MSEELQLVTDFDSLRAGDLVVVKPCGRMDCGDCHRMMLVRFVANCHVAGPTRKGRADVWEGAPPPRCFPTRFGVSPGAVAQRIIFRVVIPPAAETRETARPKKLARVK